jgi:eukaryotic-like serine/threonine-protein kinase
MSSIGKDVLAALGPLLDQVLDLDPDEREIWFAALRLERPGLARELESLLEQEGRLETRRFLEGDGSEGLFESRPSLAGVRIGAYTLEERIGQGGMGSVWLARRSDGRFEGKAAVKLLNLALVDPVGVERFGREGTVLAQLAHPNIARLLDAGVTEAGQAARTDTPAGPLPASAGSRRARPRQPHRAPRPQALEHPG